MGPEACMLNDISMSERIEAFLESSVGLRPDGSSSDTAQGSGSAEPNIKNTTAPKA